MTLTFLENLGRPNNRGSWTRTLITSSLVWLCACCCAIYKWILQTKKNWYDIQNLIFVLQRKYIPSWNLAICTEGLIILPALELRPLNCSLCNVRGVNSRGGATLMHAKWIKLNLERLPLVLVLKLFWVGVSDARYQTPKPLNELCILSCVLLQHHANHLHVHCMLYVCHPSL